MISKTCYIFWKDLLMRKNHYIATTLEIILPIGIIILANLSVPSFVNEIDYDPISIEAYKNEKCIYRHSQYESILYEPSTPFTDMLMSKAACNAGYKKSSVSSGKLSDESPYFSIGIKFHDVSNSSSEIPSSLNYTLFPTNKVWNNLMKVWRYSGVDITRFSNPSLFSVIEFQRAIDASYLDLRNISAAQVYLENTNLFEKSSRVFTGVIYLSILIAIFLMVPPIVSRIIMERYTGAKELMLMMGVTRWQLWVAKFLDVTLIQIISVSGMILFLYVPLKEDSNTLKVPAYYFWFIIMYGLIGVTLFLFFMSGFFEKATLGVYITYMIWVSSFILNKIITFFVELPPFITYLMCLFPHITLLDGLSILLDYDFYGKSVKFTEKLSGKEDTLTLSNVLVVMTFNILLYSVLTWYLEQVKPGKFGVPQSYTFCFKKSYWFPKKIVGSYCNNCFQNPNDGFESVPPNLRVGVSLQNVSKIYNSLEKGVIAAVDCVSIDFYHSEISALLGHNGAGKTTVFSMITGMSYPSSGKVIVNGHDLSINICDARRSLGLCPQQDMLFNDLTTEQILKFYGVIKGLTLSNAKQEALDYIKKLKLVDVRNTQASKLSGGQKRKVSLAIALIGGSEVLILDEPTSGMDPEIRREIWEILLGFRGTRTVLLTTHFMEEADALCDRIAIMDHGKIKCYGSPMFLKSKYGKGYVLSVVIQDLDKVKDMVDFVKLDVPTAKFKSQNNRTLYFELPESEINSFPALLSGLEEKQKQNEITSYCMGVATLEDVFLRLRSGHNSTDEFDVVDSPEYKKLDMTEDNGISKVSSYALYLYQFGALLLKKWIFFKRCYKTYLMYSVSSAFFAILITFIFNGDHSKFNLNKSTSFAYSLGLYTPSEVLFSGFQDPSEKQLFKELVESFGSTAREVDDIKGVIRKIFENDFYTYVKKINLAVQYSKEEIKILHNEEAVHMVPVSLNLIHNFLLKHLNKNSSINTNISIRFANKDLLFVPGPIPKCRAEELPDYAGFQTVFYLMGPVKERFFGAKGIQLMITTSALYWLSHLLFDLVTFLLYAVVMVFGLGFSQSDEFMLHHAGELLFSILFWGSGLILFTYVISTFTKSLSAAYSINVIIYIIFTFVLYLVISSGSLPDFLQYLHPNCIAKFGYNNLCAGKQSHYIGALFLYCCVLFLFLVVKDSKILSRMIHRIIDRFMRVNYHVEDGKDELVKMEEEVVQKLIDRQDTSSATLVVSKLKRWYFNNFHPYPAVRGISFAVNKGECFGLLGVNGAGKTSTFKMLTGALPPSHGSVYACSEHLNFRTRQKYLRSIGYCPQSGGLIPVFSGREILKFFALLRGVHRTVVNQEVEKWLDKLSLMEYAKEKCGTYSGGNQRKLSTAVALIGDCPLVFLDEPTSGVDPLSRRSIWKAIEHIQKEGQSVVLTSHSMDECEALCSRLAIMVSGRFRCIGETTTLKDRFGQGYCVQLKLSNGARGETVQSLKRALAETIDPNCELMDEHLTVLQYHIKNDSIGWADLFRKLNNLKENFEILESYTASATTLEQIFIYFARNQ